MHRVDSDGYVLESGKRRFQDKSDVPPITGTLDAAEAMNALQEEIANCIELEGGTLASTAIADRTAEWRQLHDIIFDSGRLDDNSIGSLSFSKLSGEIDITLSDNTWSQNESILQYGKTSTTQNAIIQPTQISVNNTTSGDYLRLTENTLEVKDTGFITKLSGKGINFANGGGTNLIKNADIRWHSIDSTDFYAEEAPVGSGIYVFAMDATENFNTEIPSSIGLGKIFSVFLVFVDALNTNCAPVSTRFISITPPSGPPTWHIQNTTISTFLWLPSHNASLPDSATLVISYDASSLSYGV